MTRRTHALITAALFVVAALVAGCGSGGSDDARGETNIIDAQAEASTTSTSAAETTVATTVPVATTGEGSPADAAQRLYDAWFADDKVTAATVADQTAIDGIWKTAKGDYALYNACDDAEFATSGCLYRGSNGTIQFTMEKRGDIWVVIEAFYSEP